MNPATLEQAANILAQFAKQHPSTERVQQVLNGYLADILQASRLPNRSEFRQFLGFHELTELEGIVIPEEATIEDMVCAGKYKYADENITTANFPITRRGPRKLYLAHFKRHMGTKEVEQAVAALPVRQAGMSSYEMALVEDLLAVGAHPKYKELQLEFPIFCLGSSVVLGNSRGVPYLSGVVCLSSGVDERGLLLDRDYSWGSRARFLLVQSLL